jgi:hypothetical protein
MTSICETMPTMPCSNCNGEGLVPKSAHYAPDGDDLRDTCPYCLGDGFLYGRDYSEDEENE